MKAGRESLDIGIENEDASVFDLISQAEELLSRQNFKVLLGSKLKDGVLVFYRNEKGGLERIFDLSVPLVEAGGHFVMANLMGGG